MTARTETREDLILEVAEFINTDEGGYYYNHDLMQRYPIGETELEIAIEWALQLRRYGRIID